MKTMKNKTLAVIVALILLSSTAISIEAIATVNGAALYPIPTNPKDSYDVATYTAIQQGMYWTGMDANASATRILLWTRYQDKMPTTVFVIAAPNPVGVGQAVNFVFFNPQVPPNAQIGNNIRYSYTIDITDPNGTVAHFPTAGQTLAAQTGGNAGVTNGVLISDSTGSTYMQYVPTSPGNYSVKVNFVGFRYLWNSTNEGGLNDYYGTNFPAVSNSITLVVSQEPVSPIGLPNIQAFPTAYWTRPIDGQNSNWYLVSSNWLNNAHDDSYSAGAQNSFQPDGSAPNSGHILWTRPTEDNGILGGTRDGRDGVGNAFNAGSQYQPRFGFKAIMFGRLYFSPNYVYSGSSEFLDCLDLKTGQLIYEENTTSTGGMPSFGYYYSDDNPNEHGIQNPGWLFTSNYATGYEPLKGFRYLNITGVPTGFEIQGQAGENVRFVFTNKGTTANPNYYLAQWNSSRTIPGQGISSTAIDGSLASRYDWNVSSPIQFTTTPTVRAASLSTHMLWGSNGTWASGTSSPSYAYPDNVTIWAISIDPANAGKLIYMKTFQTQFSDGQNNIFERADANAQVFVTISIPSCTFNAYDMNTGNLLWSTDSQQALQPYGYYTWPSLISGTQTKIGYGMLYTGGYTGSVSAYYLTNGSLAWRQTYPTGEQKINDYTAMIALLADGKIYVGTHEHSADTPLYKGMKVRCLDAATGASIWEETGWAYPSAVAVADGVFVYWNNYDGQIYAIAKGPTSMQVEAPTADVTLGSGIVIRGSVLDVSAGTTQPEQKADFPNGVPAVSEASQSAWMEYVYMQKGKPTNTTGVPVTISVIDSNNNLRVIGNTTSDDSGSFSLNWVPDISGKYTVIASFAGSESYWPQSAETSFAVDQAVTTSTPATTVSTTAADTYFIPAVLAIIIVIIIVGAILGSVVA